MRVQSAQNSSARHLPSKAKQSAAHTAAGQLDRKQSRVKRDVQRRRKSMEEKLGKAESNVVRL
jgi:hypothetical protein